MKHAIAPALRGSAALLSAVALSLAVLPFASLNLAIAQAPAKPVLANRSTQPYGQLALSFEANRGQADPRVRFTSHGNGYSLFLTGTEAVLALTRAPGGRPRGARAEASLRPHALKSDILRMQLDGANPTPAVSGQDQLPGTANYFLGADPTRWRRDVPTYSRVSYSKVYPGIDLVYYGNQRQLEYDFIVAPGASPQTIRLRFDGAKRVRIEQKQDLIVSAANGSIVFHKPVAYQIKDGQRRPVAGRFVWMTRNAVGFALGRYDRTRPLIIDPVLTYATYLGGTGGDRGVGIAVDASNSAYITGQTSSPNFPVTASAFQQASTAPVGEAICFVSKLNAAGTALVYSTYLGGSIHGAAPTGIAVDSFGDAYVTGLAVSDFPVTPGAYQTTNLSPGAGTGFVAKLNPTGSALLFSTFLGGSGGAFGQGDVSNGIALDSAGDAYLTGQAFSSDFPSTPGAYQSVNNGFLEGGSNAFVAKLNPAGSALVYSTFLGGLTAGYGLADYGNSIAVDAAGGAFIAGSTSSLDFPATPGAFQAASRSAGSTGFVARLNPSGSVLVYSTFLGGSSFLNSPPIGDSPFAIAVDSADNAYITGTTYSTDFPITAGAYQTVNKEPGSVFVTKLNPSGTGLVYSTYLGGTGFFNSDFEPDSGAGIAVDSAGNAIVTGQAFSVDFPVTAGAIQAVDRATGTSYLTKLNPAGSALLYSTYLGGSYQDEASGVALDHSGNAYLVGTTGSFDFPVTSGAAQRLNYSGSLGTAFVAKVAFAAAAGLVGTITTETASANPQTSGLPVTFTATVAAKTGSGVPSGTVVFTVDGKLPQPVALDPGGHAAFTTSTLTVGSHGVMAAYGTTAAFTGSTVNFIETIILPMAPPPILSPAAGTYPAAQLVSMSSGTPGAKIYYSTDGIAPTTSSTRYSAPITVTAAQTLEAINVAPGYLQSPIAAATYVVLGSPTALAVPVIVTTSSKTMLSAVVNTFGLPGTYRFKCGTSPTALTSMTASKPLVGVPGPVKVTSPMTNMSAHTTYYYQVEAVTAGGTASGAVLSFTTP